jgi:hypothetical protein
MSPAQTLHADQTGDDGIYKPGSTHWMNSPEGGTPIVNTIETNSKLNIATRRRG